MREGFNEIVPPIAIKAIRTMSPESAAQIDAGKAFFVVLADEHLPIEDKLLTFEAERSHPLLFRTMIGHARFGAIVVCVFSTPECDAKDGREVMHAFVERELAMLRGMLQQ